MVEQEGVIKYQLEHSRCSIGHEIDLTHINTWRTIMFRLQLIGQIPERYEGLGFGNISQRLAPSSQCFIISGTQTGHLVNLTTENYCIIQNADLLANKIASRGSCKPSSEALTHASVYLHKPEVQCIIHVHCPEIWKHTATLALPNTSKQIAYGTPDMATAVGALLQNTSLNKVNLFTMLGHEDGVVAFGKNMQETAIALIHCLSKAIALEQHAIATTMISS